MAMKIEIPTHLIHTMKICARCGFKAHLLHPSNGRLVCMKGAGEFRVLEYGVIEKDENNQEHAKTMTAKEAEATG